MSPTEFSTPRSAGTGRWQCEQHPLGVPSDVAPPAITPESASEPPRLSETTSHIRPHSSSESACVRPQGVRPEASDPFRGSCLKALSGSDPFRVAHGQAEDRVHAGGRAPRGVSVRKVTAEPGRFERMGGSEAVAGDLEPASGKPDVSIEVNVGDGDPDAMNVIVNQTGTEPGKPAYPEIAERGATTPSGWILMADVGWVMGWRAPKSTTFEQVATSRSARPRPSPANPTTAAGSPRSSSAARARATRTRRYERALRGQHSSKGADTREP